MDSGMVTGLMRRMFPACLPKVGLSHLLTSETVLCVRPLFTY